MSPVASRPAQLQGHKFISLMFLLDGFPGEEVLGILEELLSEIVM